MASLHSGYLVQPGFTVLGPGVVALGAVRALWCGPFLSLEFIKAAAGVMGATADAADDVPSTAGSVMTKLLASVASQGFRSEGSCGERSPYS